MNNKQIKQKIYEYEYYNNGFKHLNGTDVIVSNLKVLKRENKAIADVTLIYDMETNHSERFNDCEYLLDKL
jgi:hypothetical protein